MRLRCYLREGRGERSLREMADLSGVSAGELSLIERGRLLPADDQIEGIEQAYGMPRTDWHHDWGKLAIEADEEAGTPG